MNTDSNTVNLTFEKDIDTQILTLYGCVEDHSNFVKEGKSHIVSEPNISENLTPLKQINQLSLVVPIVFNLKSL